MRSVGFLLLLGFLLSLGTVDFCFAQWQPFGPKVRQWEIDVESGQFWPVDMDKGSPRRRFERAKDQRVPISLPEGRMLKPDQAEIISGIIKDDFLVNDDTTGGWHYWPAVTMNSGGDFVICWVDGRNDDGDIYAQRYNSSGDTLGAIFRVNDDVGGSYQYSPSLAMDADGDFVICWQDYRNYDSDIYAQRYNSLGYTLGGNFRVNDDVGESYQFHPSLAMDADGNFVICWMDERNGDYDIYAQRYNNSGDTLRTNFNVNDDSGPS